MLRTCVISYRISNGRGCSCGWVGVVVVVVVAVAAAIARRSKVEGPVKSFISVHFALACSFPRFKALQPVSSGRAFLGCPHVSAIAEAFGFRVWGFFNLETPMPRSSEALSTIPVAAVRSGHAARPSSSRFFW